jgi:SMC interacting uncharacterized protein involved in chromosome segregation
MPSNDETLQIILQEQAAMKEQIKALSNEFREQKKLTESVHTLALTVRDLTNEQKTLSSSVATVKKDVDELKEKPAKRWESVVTVIITAIVTATITYLLTHAGLK